MMLHDISLPGETLPRTPTAPCTRNRASDRASLGAGETREKRALELSNQRLEEAFPWHAGTVLRRPCINSLPVSVFDRRRFGPQGTQAPSTKHQAPSTKHQAPSKHQASTKHQTPPQGQSSAGGASRFDAQPGRGAKDERQRAVATQTLQYYLWDTLHSAV
ncbi:hypothetical protein G6O67_008522 [Ophiocordyceps sinensis]|uniref:Uncharacterized protein n=1 Tax=Ophiocordyceps sinensis TaxID=72228 RepID=A0A8H4LRL4_9HYPO|nr:hypothetical protein G6O67_008522 [Ophiocordyceps sinensis]